MDKEITINPNIQEATDILAQLLVKSEPFLKYQQANKNYQADHQAMQLLQEYSGIQQKIRSQQHTNQIKKNDLTRLREIQNLINENETIQSFGLAQESAIAFLREVNQEISQLLGFDFASLTQSPGAC